MTSVEKYINDLRNIHSKLYDDMLIKDKTSKLLKEQKYIDIARIFELIGTTGINVESMDYRCTTSDSIYIFSRCLNISCLYYYAFGNKRYAKILSRVNYEKHYNYYQEVINSNNKLLSAYKRGDYLAHDFELLGDICIFIDHKLSRSYYVRALELYKNSDVYDSEWYLNIDTLDYITALKICFKLEECEVNIMPNRIDMKIKHLYKLIK